MRFTNSGVRREMAMRERRCSMGWMATGVLAWGMASSAAWAQGAAATGVAKPQAPMMPEAVPEPAVPAEVPPVPAGLPDLAALGETMAAVQAEMIPMQAEMEAQMAPLQARMIPLQAEMEARMAPMQARIEAHMIPMMALMQAKMLPMLQGAAAGSGGRGEAGMKDDLFGGTEKFAKGATEATEVNQDPDDLDEVHGQHAARAHRMLLNSVHHYEFEKAGMYSQAEVEEFRKKLEAPGWHCTVHTRDLKSGETTDVCSKWRSADVKESAIITAEPKELTFIHRVERVPVQAHEGDKERESN